MNILTFDIEEWAVLKASGNGSSEKYAEYDCYLEKILNALDENNEKGTFFCTGKMAEDFPGVVKLIQSRGHEIGCHSNQHTWMNKMTETEAREDTYAAVSNIEQCIGQKVISYRAPAFSIGKANLWMFDILAQNGIELDASIFPADRDFGGFPGFGYNEPCVIEHSGIKIKEFPICITKVLGRDIAFSGGGYFRFFPYSFIKKRIINSNYSMCYFHIGDLIRESNGVLSKDSYEAYFKEPGTLKARYIRYFKSNIGKKRAMSKMIKLVNQVDFINLLEADNIIDWDIAPIVKMIDA